MSVDDAGAAADPRWRDDELGRLKSEADEITIDQQGCARCDGDGHPGITFKRLTRPIELEPGVKAYTLTHWAMCPTTGEPILMRFVEVPDGDGD